MAHSTFSFPTETVFGTGVLSELPAQLQRLGIWRPLVITDAGIVQTPAFGRLAQVLNQNQHERPWFTYSEVHPNPTEHDVAQAAEHLRKHECDGVIAFGGGSALDAAKASRLVAKRPELDLRSFDGSGDWGGLLPLIAIPTTAGTGSEMGRSSVITIQSEQRKRVLFHASLLARLVLLDPEVTRELPAPLTAATGLDALTHCIESFTSPTFHPLCDGIALEGIHMIAEALPRAYRDGSDMDARGKMQVAAAMGAIAFQKDLGAVHSLAHPLSTLAGIHHGTANAICLPHVMRFNANRKPGLYQRVGIACGLDIMKATNSQADLRTIDFIEAFIAALGIKMKLRDYGVSEGQIEALAQQAFEDSCHWTNPVEVTLEDLKELYRAAL